MEPVSVPARVSLVTLGVADVARSTEFYERLGWPLSSASVPGEVSFFRTAGGLLAVWGAAELAADMGAAAAAPRPSRAVALAVNCDSAEQVDEALATAAEAGATIVKGAGPTHWGGYQGYFADPDGHVWEIAHNPGWPIGADGRPALP
ncbi:MAG TPA: VOC family protein [Acidimicrobiales bacterium]|nr:VOC family protein [Acidimicrobiales bacterium]